MPNISVRGEILRALKQRRATLSETTNIPYTYSDVLLDMLKHTSPMHKKQ